MMPHFAFIYSWVNLLNPLLNLALGSGLRVTFLTFLTFLLRSFLSFYMQDLIWDSKTVNIFQHNFQSSINTLCSCMLETESVTHFFLRCHNYTNTRITFPYNLNHGEILRLINDEIVNLLLFDIRKYGGWTNQKV